jgi:hypothetical protein
VTRTEHEQADVASATPDEIRAGIEQTRAELGGTVEALTAKLDVKSRAKDKLGATRDEAARRLRAGTRQASELTDQARARASAAAADGAAPRTLLLVAVVAAGVTVLGVAAWRRRHG